MDFLFEEVLLTNLGSSNPCSSKTHGQKFLPNRAHSWELCLLFQEGKSIGIPIAWYKARISGTKKRGFQQRGFCRIQDQNKLRHWTQQYIWHSKHHS